LFTRTGLVASVVALSLPLVFAAPAGAAECAGARFADTIDLGNAKLALNGMGIRKATIFSVKVYVAGLYLTEKTAETEKILGKNQEWEIKLQFLRDVDAADMHKAFREGFDRVTGAKPDTLQTRIDKLNGMIVDAQEGHTLTLANEPDKGVSVDVNGKAAGTIEGADFAVALLSIWLGPDSIDDGLKEGLLGGKCG
jgi:hypothetical protein